MSLPSNNFPDPQTKTSTTPLKGAPLPGDTIQRRITGGAYFRDSSLLAICRAIVSNLQLSEVLNTILVLTLQEVRAQEGSILLFSESEDRLEMLASLGLPEEIARRGYLPRKGSIAEWVIANNEPTILNGDVQGRKYSSASKGRLIVSAMCVPLRAGGKVIGTINLNRTDPEQGPFQKRDVDAMAILAAQAAISIENSRLHQAMLVSERLAAIGQTVAGISHCMKNLLTSLKGGLAICEMGNEKQDWMVETKGLEIVRRGIQRISALALDMLDFSKERVPSCSTVNLEDMRADLTAMTGEVAAKKGNRLLFDFSGDALTVWADYDQLFRCLLNLVQNGMDANPEGGAVTVSSRREDSPEARTRLTVQGTAPIVIRVTDSGKGIPEELLPRLFEPFFSTKGSRGTGLGLAVTRKIIKEHGGTLELASKPGEPASFTIYLGEKGIPG